MTTVADTFTLTGTLLHHDNETPHVEAGVEVLAGVYPDEIDGIVYTGGKKGITTDADGVFSAELITEPDLFYTVRSTDTPKLFAATTFEAPAVGTTLNLASITSTDPGSITPSVLTQTIAARDAAVEAQQAAEAAQAEAESLAGSNNTQVAGFIETSGPTKDALSATLAATLSRSAFITTQALPVVAHDSAQTTAEIINPDGAGTFGITWAANPDIMKWRGKFYAAFDGNRAGGTTEAASGQKIQLITSTDGTTWADGGQVFSDAATATNPIAGDGHFQPNLLAPAGDDGPLLCFWQNGASAFMSTLPTPTGKWTTRRFEFTPGTATPVLSTTISGAAAGGRSLTATLDVVSDYRPFIPARPVVLSDGVIAVALTYQSLTVQGVSAPPTDGEFYKRLKTNIVWYSTDDGETWEASDPIQPGNNSYWEAAWEPFLLERRDGAIQVFSRNNKSNLRNTPDSTVQLSATSFNRKTFTMPTPTRLLTSSTRGQAVRQGESRWLAAHVDAQQRVNGALFVSRTGRDDFVAGPSYAGDGESVVYPQVLVVGDVGYVIHTADRRGRRALRLSVVDVNLDEDKAYLYPRRLTLGNAVGPVLLSSPARWRFNGASKVSAPAAFNQAAFTAASWLQVDDPVARLVFDFRQSAVADDSGSLVVRTDAVSVGGINLTHGLTVDGEHPTLFLLRADGSTGHMRLSVLGSTSTDLSATYDCYVKSLGTTGAPADGDTVIVGANTYTFRTAPTLTRDVQINGTDGSLTNLAAKLVADGLSTATISRPSGNRLAIAKADGTTFTLTGCTAVPVVATPFTSGTGAPAIGYKAQPASTILGLIADVYEWKLFAAELSDAQAKGVFNARATAFGFAAMSGAAAVPAAAVTFDETSTSGTFPSLSATAPRAVLDGTDLVIYGEASASVELPYDRTVVQLTYQTDEVPTSGHRYRIATFGSANAPIYLYTDSTSPNGLILGNGSTGPQAAAATGLTVRDPSTPFRVEVIITETTVTVGTVTKPIDSRRMHLGHAYPDGITVLATPAQSTRYKVADMRISDAKYGIRNAGVKDSLDLHAADTSNPHAVTKAQVGLGSADNTSDANKPVSTPQQTALNGKVGIGEVLRSKSKVGRYYLPPYFQQQGASAPVNNFCYAVPFAIGRDLTLDRIGCYVTTAGNAGATLRLGIYDDDGTGFPGALLLDAGTVLADVAATARELTINLALTKRLVWLCMALQNAATSAPTVPVSAASSPAVGWTDLSNMAQGNARSYAVSGISGALPATWPSGSEVLGNRAPMIVLRASA